MSRRSARAAQALAALRGSDESAARTFSGERVEDGWTVRSVGPSDKPYVCPGCLQQVLHVAHVVAWPEGRTDDRRHWHTPCWNARGRRGPDVERSRSAPRR